VKAAYNKRMERLAHAPRNPVLLILGVSGFVVLSAFINIFAPEGLWQIGLFVCVFSVSSGVILQYIFRRTQQSVILGFAIAIFLILRLFGLRNPLYLILLLACVLALELTMRKR
jgi:hypothetical protein